MKLKAINICNALGLDDAKKILVKRHADELTEQYRRLHKPGRDVVQGMYNKNILDFENEQYLNDYFPFPMYG